MLQVGLLHNNCFRNKAKLFLVIRTGGIVQHVSVTVIGLSCEEAAVA